MAILFQIEGLVPVLDAVDGVIRRTRDRAPALRFIGETLLVRNEDRLARGEDFEGNAMTPSRRAKELGGQTMVDQGNLAGSVNYDVVGGTDLDLFSTDIRAAVHWKGKTIKPKHGKYLTIVFDGPEGLEFRKVEEIEMPERHWFGINEAGDLDMAGTVLGRHVAGEDLRGGGRA